MIMNTLKKDGSTGNERHGRERGSTIDEKRTNVSVKYKLKYDQQNYKDQKDKVIEARIAK